MPLRSIAINRFGLGGRPDEDPPADPRRWLREQFASFEPTPAAFSAIPTRAQVADKLAAYADERPDSGKRDDPEKVEALQMARRRLRRNAQDQYRALAGARARAAVLSKAPFIERLVHFWANHFAISVDKQTTVGFGGLLEVEAIRPHVLGRFADMLGAVEQHPAMLLYLDQVQSVGPESVLGLRAAQRRGVGRVPGLNENLAREILELHTLGVRSGYSQADVTEFARALTGWSIAGVRRGPAARIIGDRARPGTFVFVEDLHQPGTRTIMGRHYGQKGFAQGAAILGDLAASPATAHHIATKLARHFVADNPPPALVQRLTATFLDSGGDLRSIYSTLIAAEEAWVPGPAKFKTPWEWSISALRALGSTGLADNQMADLLAELGQPTWRPGSPAGYDDTAPSWAGSDGLVKRVEAAERLAQRLGGGLDPRSLCDKILPGVLTQQTADAVARAESLAQGLALFLVSPEFLRR